MASLSPITLPFERSFTILGVYAVSVTNDEFNGLMEQILQSEEYVGYEKAIADKQSAIHTETRQSHVGACALLCVAAERRLFWKIKELHLALIERRKAQAKLSEAELISEISDSFSQANKLHPGILVYGDGSLSQLPPEKITEQ